jgi:prolyl oligopeptidase
MRLEFLSLPILLTLAGAASAEETDPFLWLEDVGGARAMDWVKAENAKTLAVLEADPRYKPLYDDALKIAEAKDRIPVPQFLGGQVYNFWQDSEHAHGIWRHVPAAGYRDASPAWVTALDLDALSQAEHANWFWKGADCAEPAERRCLLELSDGGEDAVTIREFDLGSAAFVKDGFVLPHGKQRVAWSDPDTLLVAREWRKGELTTSGYPFVVKQLRRGAALDSAQEVFRGAATDGGYGVSPVALDDGAGHHALEIERPLTTFEQETYLLTPQGPARLGIPRKADAESLVEGRLIVHLHEDWHAGGKDFKQGSLVSVELAAALADPGNLKPTLIFEPNPRQALQEFNATRDRLVVSILDNVKGRILVFTPLAGGGWASRPLDLPDNIALGIADTELHGDAAFLTASGFLTPSSLYAADVKSGEPVAVKSLPAQFDATGLTVDQLEAVSTDGTRIPYFLVRSAALKRDGSNPTILTAYGGFEVSRTPFYSGNIGKLWLNRGGVFVLANIRGGGEFGPAWHEAGLKTHRQRIYDDFAAVARDLIRRKITSPRRLGIEGGSNGGLLMGVEFTQHPELWNAVDIQVPLLDMLRFEQIAAGSSWVGEYGSVSVPAERAFLASISPYNNLKPGVDYPEPLIWTTTKDDRVGPQHARKFAARLAALGRPYLFYEVIEGGHGAGANLSEKAHTTALEMTYFSRKLMD